MDDRERRESTQSEASVTLKRKIDTPLDEAEDRVKRRQENGTRPSLRATSSLSTPQLPSRPADPFAPPEIPAILPHNRVFPIQIGTELFQLSGASISSDAPSYFSNFFEKQLKDNPDAPVRTLYIDRDPETFKDICLHLQGYFSAPRDATHFVRMFADAQFYSLPKMIQLLFETEMHILIGGRNIVVPRDLFSAPGDSPNFFTLGFGVFFTSPADAFPGLQPHSLLRPPSMHPPSVPHKSPDNFADLLMLLRGYDLHIRNDEHRSGLIKDCKYYHLRGLEQKLVKHSIFTDATTDREQIMIRLEDIKPSGLSTEGGPGNSPFPGPGWLRYARPYADKQPRDLLVEITSDIMLLDVDSRRVNPRGIARTKLASLLSAVAKNFKVFPKAFDSIPIDATSASNIKLDGVQIDKLTSGRWIVHRGQWRIQARFAGELELYLQVINIDATTSERASIARRGFL